MATITIPTDPGGWKKVTPVPCVVPKRRWESPTTLQTQTFLADGEKFVVTLTLPSMPQSMANAWIKFLRDAEKANETFYLDLSNWLSSDIADRAAAPCQLVIGSAQFDHDRDNGAMHVISFQVERSQ